MDWVDVASKLGFPAVCLIFAGYASWRGGRWVGEQIFIPIRDRTIKFLDDLTNWNLQLGERLAALSDDYIKHHTWENGEMARQDAKLNTLLDIARDLESRRQAHDARKRPGTDGVT